MANRIATAPADAPLEQKMAENLRERFRGELIYPGGEGYDDARRVWNGMIDKRPAVIARCAGVADVIEAVNFARANEIVVAVRGGGHNVAGNAVCDGGMVIDLSRMKGIRVDPSAGRARAQPGVLWGEFDHETQAFGLATTGGIQSTTGIAGFTLGGGIGWLSRKHAHTCDNLISADVVTADGRLLKVSASEHEDLFFAIRGGGGNYGIATSFEYRLHPVEFVLGGMVLHRLERAPEVLAFFRDYLESAPDHLGAIAFFITAARAPHIPEHLRGRPVVTIGICYTGPARDAEDVVRPLRRFGPPDADLLGPMPYRALQSQLDAANPAGYQNYWKAEYLAGLSDGAIEAIAEHASRKPTDSSKVLLTRLGGAAGRVPEDEMAFSHRHAPFIININGMGPDPGERDRLVSWARDFWSAMQPYSSGGVYVNFLGEEGEARVRSAYGEGKYDRLVALKTRYDPANFFHLNQNIKPAP
jgi:FAD/FMN-containing dehydrogenase